MQKCHSKRDNQYKLTVLVALPSTVSQGHGILEGLYATYITRSEAAAPVDGTLASTPTTKFSWGSFLQHHHRSFPTQGHAVPVINPWDSRCAGRLAELRTHFYQGPTFPLMAKVCFFMTY